MAEVEWDLKPSHDSVIRSHHNIPGIPVLHSQWWQQPRGINENHKLDQTGSHHWWPPSPTPNSSTVPQRRWNSIQASLGSLRGRTPWSLWAA